MKGRLQLLIVSFLLVTMTSVATQIALAQGYQVTQLNPPNSQAGSTQPIGVNTTLAVVGNYMDTTTGKRRGFLYAKNKYTVIDPPADTGGYTRANGINDGGTIVGDFQSSDTRFHGYIYSGGTYTTYDETQTESCGLFGINKAGSLVGSVGNSSGPIRGFINIGGSKTEFQVNGNTTYVYAINSSNQVVGEYIDSSSKDHGFFRDSNGTITEVAYPGASQTIALGINDKKEITGTYTLPNGLTYGFTLVNNSYASTDFAFTGGVNNKGAYAGYYWGVDGVASGYLAAPHKFTLATVTVAGNQQAQLWGINKAGVTVGNYVDSSGHPHGMMISTGGSISNIDDPKGASTICWGINASNQIVGAYFDTQGNPHGYQYTNGTFTDVPGPAGSVASLSFGINDSGDISGLSIDSTGAGHGYILKGTTYTQLDVPGANLTLARGINNSDEVTMQWRDSAGYMQSSLYKKGKYTKINVPGAAVNQAQGIDTKGDVTYFWSDPYGVTHAALKKGSKYYVYDYPGGTNTGAGGINDSLQMVGSYNPAGKTVPQAFTGH